jgi:hypothetical protein
MPWLLLHFGVFCGIIWLIIIAEVCHYWCVPIFTLYYVDYSGLQ